MRSLYFFAVLIVPKAGDFDMQKHSLQICLTLGNKSVLWEISINFIVQNAIKIILNIVGDIYS